MASFPSPDELIVASALLLLSTTDSESAFDFGSAKRSLSLASRGSSKRKAKSFMSELCGESTVMIGTEEESEISKPKKSKRSSSSYSAKSSVVNCTSSIEISAHSFSIVSVVSHCHEMKFKVVKKRRTQVSWISDNWKTFTSENAPWKASSESEFTEVSCLSVSSSANASSAQSRLMTICGKRKSVSSPTGSSSGSMSRRAESILELLLSSGCITEMKIRKVLGDSPDTSKALRMLLKLEEVKRSGTGGHRDPYMYMIA